MEERPSLLFKLKPISDRLPSVQRPEGHVHFRTKMMWVIVVLVLYFVMTNVYIYGLDQGQTMDISPKTWSQASRKFPAVVLILDLLRSSSFASLVGTHLIL